jgi:predicted secreted protein
MKRKYLVVFVTVLVLSLGALIASMGQDEYPSDLNVYLDGATVLREGKMAEVKVDDVAAVILEENPSTGYIWEYVIEPEGILTEEEKESFNKTEEKLVGAPKMAVWRFRAESAGDVTLTFKYLRPWEEEGVVKTKIFKVRIVE